MRLITLQTKKVIDILKSGETYYADFNKIFYSEYKEQWKRLSQYFNLEHCPIFCAPANDTSSITGTFDYNNDGDNRIELVLNVPDSECHTFSFYDFSDYLYFSSGNELSKKDAKKELDNIEKYIHSDVKPVQVVIDKIKPEWLVKAVNESLLIEKTRGELLAKSKAGKATKTYGTNRYNRKDAVRIYSGVKHFNDLDMSGLFLANTLTLKLPIQGETNNYIVTVLFKGACDDIRQEIKANGYKVEFKAVYRALVKAVNRLNIYVGCTCPDMKYRFNYWATRHQYTTDKPQLVPAKETNPKDDQGAGCKHVMNVLDKLDWVLELATTINNYILYMSENMFDKYRDLMFKPLYGMSYDEAVRKGIVGESEEAENDDLDFIDEPEEEPTEPETNNEPEAQEEPIEEPVEEPVEEPEGEDNQ